MVSHIEIALPLVGIEGIFTYKCDAVPPIGSFVEVPFRNKIRKGIVWSHDNTQKEIAEDKIKPLHAILPFYPLTEACRSFIKFVASYTMTPLGSILKMVIDVQGALETMPLEKIYTKNPVFPKNIVLSKERCKILAFLKKATEEGKDVTCDMLVNETRVNASVIQSMVKKEGLCVSEKEKIYAFPYQWFPPHLSSEQEECVGEMKKHLEKSVFIQCILEGVTGSGKTEVYFSVIQHALFHQKKQILVLLPEILLTRQLVARFEARFGCKPLLWHSSLAPSERRKTWNAVIHKEPCLVIGARSSLLLPFQDLGCIVIDEEHENSYKQEEGVLYNARDMAIAKSQKEGCLVILASATPSLESYYNIQKKKAYHLTLPHRFGGAVLPAIKAIDMRQQKMEPNRWLSNPLKHAMKEALDTGNQVLLYLNRKGYAPLTLCRACGHRIECPHCVVNLVYHLHPTRLQCHYCNFMKAIPHHCPACKKEEAIIQYGPGVERIEEEVRHFFPEVRTLIVTSETVKNQNEAQKLVDDIITHQYDVIIGTQMLAKGHHFPHLTLVGVIDADAGLSGDDFRAAERTYQLLHQVSGRAGREQKKGYVFLQSYMPENNLIMSLIKGERENFLLQEMIHRKARGLPPFGRLASLIISGKKEEDVIAVTKMMKKKAPCDKDVEILGPAPAVFLRLRGVYRYRFLLKTKHTSRVQYYIKEWLDKMSFSSYIKLKIDIDPYSFM